MKKTITLFHVPIYAMIFVACTGSPLDATPNVAQASPIKESSPTPGSLFFNNSTETPISEDVKVLHLELADKDWNGERIPDGQQCLREGGINPSTPSILVANIPAGTVALILEFSDRDFYPMNNGGHGKVGFVIEEGASEVLIPSILGNTFDLSEDFFIVQEHLTSIGEPGAYMPPCSGGGNHEYYVTVKAVDKIESENFGLLGYGILELGIY